MDKVFDRVKVGTETTGTGNLTLGPAEAGFQTWIEAGAVDGDTVAYVIEDGNAFEIGYGVLGATGTLLNRNVIASSNAGAAIDLSGDAKVISAIRKDMWDGKSDVGHTHDFSTLTNKPTTLAGYGITDAANIAGADFTGGISATRTDGAGNWAAVFNHLGGNVSRNGVKITTAGNTSGTEALRIDTGAVTGALVVGGDGAVKVAGTVQSTASVAVEATGGGAKTVRASGAGSQLILEQTGGTYGGTRLTIENENGANGATFENLGINLVDFGFKTAAGQRNIRYEARPGFQLGGNSTWEFQFGGSTTDSACFMIGDTQASLTTPLYVEGNRVATLDAGGKVPAAQLPSYVDDVLEFANLAAFPATGETGKIYIAIDTGWEYRWSGSLYTQIVASPGSTDAVPEGSINLYFTDARAQDALADTIANYVLTSDFTFANLGGKPTTLAGYGISNAVAASEKGAANGVATLDAAGTVPSVQLPANIAPSSVTTPWLSMGTGGGAAGSVNKIALYDGGAGAQLGFGISSFQMDYVIPNGQTHNFYIGNSRRLQIHSAGAALTGTLTQTSDVRLKTNIRPLENGLEICLGVSARRFEMRDTPGVEHVGVIAQEIEDILPELVHTDTDGFKSVDYARLSVVLLEAVKTLNARVEMLEKAA